MYFVVGDFVVGVYCVVDVGVECEFEVIVGVFEEEWVGCVDCVVVGGDCLGFVVEVGGVFNCVVCDEFLYLFEGVFGVVFGVVGVDVDDCEVVVGVGEVV